jgi:hypothetical protein
MVDTYKAVLVRFMSYLNGHQYDKDYDFSQEELAPVKPIDLKKYFCYRAYGIAEPGPDDNPLFARSSSLAFWKKAISHFMPNKLMPWNAIAQVGNPTKSIEVNELIKAIKKKEVRKQGKASSARRALTHQEFLRMLELLKAENQDDMHRYGLPSLFVFQYNLIARIDDTCMFLVENLTDTPDFDFVLRSKLDWSKNVDDEREAPNQILLAAMDYRYCVQLALAVHTEIFLESAGQGGLTPFVFGFSEDINRPEGGVKTKKEVQSILHNEIFCREEFNDRGRLGSHSNRKYASTHCRKNGCSKDEKELRGRWKKGKRVADVYDDVDLPFPDAKVAGKLCMGGPCKYVVKEGSGVTDNFLLEYVVPHVRTRYSDGVAKILGKALLWLIFSPHSDYLPQALRDRVQTAYSNIARLPAGENPIKKIPLVVSGSEGEVYLDELGGGLDGGAENDAGGAENGAVNGRDRTEANQRQQILALHSQLAATNRRLDAMTAADQAREVQRRREFQILNANFRRYAIRPVARRANNQEAEAAAEPNQAPYASTLCPNPRTLYNLWEEYENGIGGRKAASLFSSQERGRVKHKYHRRKVVWDCISGLVRAGFTAQVAIDRIYNVYGVNAPVTRIINQMKRDRQTGNLHRSLQI